jgi:D-sedoheptulose 7-phosphate isomerase
MRDIDYFKKVIAFFQSINFEFEHVVAEIAKCSKNGNSIWIFGNGGSASTADHFETDLSFVRLENDLIQLHVKSLVSNAALITAIANDIGFEFIFSHQLRRNAKEGDICFAISASGNSPNLIEAFKVAKEMKLKTISLLGFDGGALKAMSDFSILVPTPIGEYGPVEDIHLSICHFLASQVKNKICAKESTK